MTPVPDAVSKPFWDACNERRLIVQSCADCTRLQYPPDKSCRKCESANLGWQEVSGNGAISGYIVVHDSRMRMWWPDQPYNVAVVQLEEDPAITFFSNLPGVPVDQVPVGAKVQVDFVEAGPNQLVHEWRLST